MTGTAESSPCGPALHPQVALRAPEEVMRLERMGSFFPTRLSFMRSTIRALAAEQQQVRRVAWEMDADGYGHAVYSVDLEGHTYSLVAFSNALEPDMRTDRVIAEAWDSAYVLFDGTPTTADIDRLRDNAPSQEAGRFSPSELVLSRANKSLRLFEHVASRLAEGQQPDAEMIQSIGYLMRTTAVYGNGKFGIADRNQLLDRPHMSGPFQPEMLTVWLIRGFTFDLVEHVARQRNPASFVPLDDGLKRFLGVGNATGLGMAPFLVSHPVLINNWMLVRETALARVRAVQHPAPEVCDRMHQLIDRVALHLQQWIVDDERQMKRIITLRREWGEVRSLVTPDFTAQIAPWDAVMQQAGRWSLECQELVVALLLEPHGELVDGLTGCMASDVGPRFEPAMTLTQLRQLVDSQWAWAVETDFASHEESAQFWYVSEDKLEPRLGLRYEEPGAELEEPLDIARRVQQLALALQDAPDQTVGSFVASKPQHRHACTRVQNLARYPYAEIRDNLIGQRCLPIDMLRSKLSFFGASKFDPKSDRWTRVTLFQGAPLFDQLGSPDVDDWWLPTLTSAAAV